MSIGNINFLKEFIIFLQISDSQRINQAKYPLALRSWQTQL